MAAFEGEALRAAQRLSLHCVEIGEPPKRWVSCVPFVFPSNQPEKGTLRTHTHTQAQKHRNTVTQTHTHTQTDATDTRTQTHRHAETHTHTFQGLLISLHLVYIFVCAEHFCCSWLTSRNRGNNGPSFGAVAIHAARKAIPLLELDSLRSHISRGCEQMLGSSRSTF